MDGHKPTRGVNVQDVQRYWQANPVAARANPHPLGSPEYFDYYDALREANEPIEFSRELHEFVRFAGGRVLDVGSGNGYVLSRYAAAGARTVGIDLTRAAVDLCRRRFELRQLAGSFVQGNAEDLPFVTGSFDCVCSMGVLHHTPDTARAVREVHRVLKPGGRMIVMFYHRESFLYRVKFPVVRTFTGKSIQQQVDEVDGVGNPKGDVYSKRELLTLLQGFTNVELFAGQLPWHKLGALKGVLPAGLRRSAERRWGWFLYAKADKLADKETIRTR
jgi:SAM-dependent methyltransferase